MKPLLTLLAPLLTSPPADPADAEAQGQAHQPAAAASASDSRVLPILPTVSLSASASGKSDLAAGFSYRRGSEEHPRFDHQVSPEVGFNITEGRTTLIELSDGDVSPTDRFSFGLDYSLFATEFRYADKFFALADAQDEAELGRRFGDCQARCAALQACAATDTCDAETRIDDATRKWCETKDPVTISSLGELALAKTRAEIGTVDSKLEDLESTLKRSKTELQGAQAALDDLRDDTTIVEALRAHRRHQAATMEVEHVNEQIGAQTGRRGQLERALEQGQKALANKLAKAKLGATFPTEQDLCETGKFDYGRFRAKASGFVGEDQDVFIFSIGARGSWSKFGFYEAPPADMGAPPNPVEERGKVTRGAIAVATSVGGILPPKSDPPGRTAGVYEGYLAFQHGFSASPTTAELCTPGPDVSVDGMVHGSESCNQITIGAPTPSFRVEGGFFFGVSGPKSMIYRIEAGPSLSWPTRADNPVTEIGLQFPLTFNALARIESLSAVKYNGVMRLIPSIGWQHAKTDTGEFGWSPVFAISVRVSGQRSFFGQALSWL